MYPGKATHTGSKLLSLEQSLGGGDAGDRGRFVDRCEATIQDGDAVSWIHQVHNRVCSLEDQGKYASSALVVTNRS